MSGKNSGIREVAEQVLMAADNRMKCSNSFIACGNAFGWEEITGDKTNEVIIRDAKREGRISPCGQYWASFPMNQYQWARYIKSVKNGRGK